MKKVIISTDSCVDELKSELAKMQVHYIPMVYILDKEYKDNFDTQEEYDNFYSKMKEGEMPTTSMLNSYELEQYFEELIKDYKGDIVHFSLSSGLSGTYDNSVLAAKAVMEKHPEYKIYVVDTLSATQGQNLLVRLAVKERDKGKTAEGVFNTLQDAKQNLQHWFFIGDLFHLRRGGRISGAKATIGTLLQTKPILYVSNAGKLEVYSKAMGTKKAIKSLATKCEEMGLENSPNTQAVIAHANYLEEAELLKKYLTKDFSKTEIIIKNIGPVIGAHTGPGALGVLFFGKERLGPKTTE